MRALVTGATGYVGSVLVPALLGAGASVSVLTRSPERVAPLAWAADVDVVTADLLAPPFRLPPADVAYYLVHALGEGGFPALDERAAAAFGAEAARAGVGRIVYLGGFLPGGRVSAHLDSRAAVGRTLAASGVDTVRLQAAAIIGSGSAPFEIVRGLVDRVPVVPLPPFMTQVVQPIGIDDVLHYLLAAADPRVLPAGVYDVAGERVTTYTGLVRTYAAVAGLRRVFVPVPFLPPGRAAPFVGRLAPVADRLVADLMPSLATPMVAAEQTIRQHVPDPLGGLASLREAISRAIRP